MFLYMRGRAYGKAMPAGEVFLTEGQFSKIGMNLASRTALENVPTKVAIWCVVKMIATLKREVCICTASTWTRHPGCG